MRNQTWNQQGQIVEDTELTRVSGIATAIDHITGTSRPATSKEAKLILDSEKEIKRQDAEAKAIADIKSNQSASPWGKILYNLAIAKRWIEPE